MNVLRRIAVPPVIEPGLQSEYVVKEGSTLRVLCEATGVPPPQIVWRRPGINGNHTADSLLSDLVRTLIFSYSVTDLGIIEAAGLGIGLPEAQPYLN